MPTECAESGCPNKTDSGICQQCAAGQKYGTTSRAYDADGSRVELREGESRDDDSHAGVVAAQLAEADAEDLEELEDEREVRTDGSGESSSGTERGRIQTNGDRSPVGGGNQVGYLCIAKFLFSTCLTEVRQHRGIALVVDQHSLGLALTTSWALHRAPTVCYIITRPVATNQIFRSAHATRSNRDYIVPDGGADKFSSDTERTVSDERTAVIEPSRGWAGETVDDRHPMRGAGSGCGELLYTQHLYTNIEIRSLQSDTDGSEAHR